MMMSSIEPLGLRRLEVGLKPWMPQKCAGPRMLPPMSEPMPSGEPHAAITAPSPPLEPPGVRSWLHGLLHRPYTGLSLSRKNRSWAMFVFPSTTPPAPRSRATSGLSSFAIWSLYASTPALVTMPPTWNDSLMVMGTP
jgi:hypothetical protein